MNNPLLLFLVPLSFLIALIIDSIIKIRLSRVFVITITIICLLLISPLILTDYTYGGLYSNVLVIATVSTIINLLWMGYVKRKDKLAIGIGLCIITFIPTCLMFFGRSFVGEPKIYNSQSIKNYRIKYLQESSPGIRDPPQVELYRTNIFGLLQKLVDTEYIGEGSTCDITLEDSLNSVVLIYNTCEQKIQTR